MAGVRQPRIFNVTVVSGTEKKFTFLDSVVRFLIQCRTEDEVQFAYEEGQSDSNYITLKAGISLSEQDLIAFRSIYFFQNSGSDKIVEISTWE